MHVALLSRLPKKIFFCFLAIFLIINSSLIFGQQDSAKQEVKDSASGKGENLSSRDTSSAGQQRFAKDDIIIGERLFHGLVYTDKSLKCSACHSVYAESYADTINWNPNALEISLKYKDLSAEDLGNVLLKPSGKKMSQVHSGFKFTPDEIRQLKAFMDEFTATGLMQKKPVITNLLVFIVACILFLVSFTDLIVTKKLKRQWINGVVASVTTVYITWVLVVNAIAIGRSKGYSPDQPIKFSHAIHAGQNQTDCYYCHNYAPYSKISGIPSGNVCMNCHLLVRNGTRSGMFEISKVVDAYNNGRAVHWIQVHNLPDHVYFNHSQHVNAGGIKCQECHGPVQEMDRIYQYSDLSMGFCLNCHRSRKVKFNENAFYTQYKSLSEKMRTGQLDSVTVDRQGGSECMRCHY